MILILPLITGCENKSTIDVEKYKNYICYDYHLVCLDADKESKAYTIVEKDDVSYRIHYRHPNGVSDEQFVCANVRMNYPLALPNLVVMQNPNKYVDVLKEWTVKKIDLYYIDSRRSKQLWEEDEPARLPTGIIGTITDSEALCELLDFVTNTDYSAKISLPEGYEREHYSDEGTQKLYIRVYFEESEIIVWESTVNSYVSKENHPRYIAIDKGRTPSGIASPKSHTVFINELNKLTASISKLIDSLFY